MSAWKWLLLAGVLAVFWIAERSLFWPFLLLSGGWAAVVVVRGRREVPPTPPLAAEAAGLLGGVRRGRGGWGVALAGGRVRIGQGTIPGQISGDLPLLTLSASVGRRVPFCFAIRPAQPPAPWVSLVENSPIPGTVFEYSLGPVTVDDGLVAAANHPGLLSDWLRGGALGTLHALGETRVPRLQGLLFNGRRLTSLWVWSAPPPASVLRLAALRTLLLAGELDALVTSVDFHQPL